MHRALPAIVVLTLTGLSQAHGVDEEFHSWDTDESVWEADAEFGMVITSGNTESETINGKFRVLNEREYWRHRLQGSGLNDSEEGDTNAERYQADYKTDYKLTRWDYIFGNLRYEKDRFANQDYRTSETVGYGRRLLDRSDLRWDAEVGAGARQLKPRDGDRENDAMLRLASDLRWEFTESGRLEQSLMMESTNEETFTESVSAIRGTMTDNLGLTLSFTVRHTDSVAADTERTDTVTAVNLSYSR